MGNKSGLFILQDTITPALIAMDITGHAKESFEDSAQDVIDYARDNAPWNDRTGDAREGLDAAVEEAGGTVILTLFHTVSYGEWLEVIQSGRFAIIMPTLEAMAPRVFLKAGGHALDIGGD